MPREVVAIAPRHLILRDYEEYPLKPNEVRLRSRLSAEKHGTHLPAYRGSSPLSRKVYDRRLGLYLQREEEEKPSLFRTPMRIGNMTVGLITEVGDEVTRFDVGDRVYGYLPIRETHTVVEDRVHLAPSELSDEALVSIDPAAVALMAVREGNVKIGDKVAVFGLGAIGLMSVQIAKASGSVLLVGIEPFEKRRRLAQRYGADVLFDPRECDVGYEIKELTKSGVDVSIEASGAYQALNQAIRSTCFGGTIVTVSRYHQEARANLGEEWHVSRQTMVSGARVESEPYRDYPRWDRARIHKTVVELFRQKRLNAEGLLDPLVEFADVIEGYRIIDKEPEKTVKLGVKYR